MPDAVQAARAARAARSAGAAPLLLGIDVGTSHVKVVAVAPDGRVLAARAVSYPSHTPRIGWSEQDPEDWWQATGAASRGVVAELRAAGSGAEIAAIGLSGQMHTFVLVGEDGRPTRPAITWMDTRAVDALAAIGQRIREVGVTERLANPVVLGLTLPPLIWLRDHEPEQLRVARTLLLAKDYVRSRMTGTTGSEPTDASATLLFDVVERRWSDELLEAFGLPRTMMPPISESAAVAGELLPDAARHLGLEAGTRVAFGAGDQQAAAVGVGTVSPRRIQLTVGTGAQVLAVRERPMPDPAGRLHTFCHVHGWITQASVNNAGSALAWSRSVLGAEREESFDGVGARPGGPWFVPYLSGERTPLMKGHARGAWIGISSAHTRADLARAATEGVVAAIAEAVEPVVASGRPDGALQAVGGVMRSAAFAQAIADATGSAVEVREASEASGVGAALLAGVAVGTYTDVDHAVASAPTRVAARYEPRAAQTDRWAAHRRLLRDLDASGFHEIVARGGG